MLTQEDYLLDDDFRTMSEESRIAYAKDLFGSYNNVDQDVAYDFFFDHTDEQKVKEYYKSVCKRDLSSDEYSYLGLIEMLNYEIISPVCVDWVCFKNLVCCYDDFLINQLKKAVTKYNVIWTLYKQRNLFLGCISPSWSRKAYCAKWKAWVEKYKDLAKLEQEQQKEKAKQAKQAAKPPKEKPEYTVSLDEMLEYYSNEGDSLIAFINHCAINKNEWFNKTVQNMIKKAQVAHHNTFNIEGNYNEIQGNTNLTVKNE